MDTLQAYRAFLRVAETTSFSRTAEELRLQQSHVSRLV
ncbi:helix-turn-helix domain-containing protein, partial [Streptococcus pneumoniae]